MTQKRANKAVMMEMEGQMKKIPRPYDKTGKPNYNMNGGKEER